MEFLLQRCWSCPATFYTLNELSTHHLDTHERPLDDADRREPWEVTPRRKRSRPPNSKAQAAREWYAPAPAANGL